MKLTITAAIHARWGHRVDGLIHTHAWTLEATVEGDPDCDKVYPVDDLEYLLTATVEPWHGHYLTNEDVGLWKGLQPLLWDREPTVEEIARRVYASLADKLPGLIEVALVESTEFDRSRTVRFTRCESDKH
jgi:6-pyruvoyl-tetrahydropterin synthase